MADAGGSGAVIVPAAGFAPHDRDEPGHFGVVELPEPLTAQAPCVVHAAKNDECAHLEHAGKALHFLANVGRAAVIDSELFERHEHLGRHPVAPLFDIVLRDARDGSIKKRRLPRATGGPVHVRA